jgi:predicted TIM-barrel fold metal-dependent hydrolase
MTPEGTPMANTTKLWANSGDSHFIEPFDLFDKLPDDIRERMPRSVKDPSGEFETVYIDGQSFVRPMPKPGKGIGAGARPEDSAPEDLFTRILGGNDAEHRIKDLDGEGVWAEVIYPSLGIWTFNIQTPRIVREGCRVLNDWALSMQQSSPRFVCAASIPLLDVDDGVAEVRRASADGFHCGFLPVKPPIGRPEWQDEEWDPLWAAFADTGMVIGIHIGTEPHDPTQKTGVYHRGRGGAVLNYTETTYGGQRAVTQLVASGALDRHPELRVLVSEGGATWGPFIADRMDEAYRQHGAGVRPKLSKLPSEYIYGQVYASFQHDSSAVKACTAMGWTNVMWGSDYPHFEGTFGHTQETLHGLFDGVEESASLRMRFGAFEELFPHVPRFADRSDVSAA